MDDFTVEIVLTQPSATFLSELGKSAGYVVPENFLEEHDANSEMIGTGPYVFSDYQGRARASRSTASRTTGARFFEVIDWRFVTDETAALNGLQAGEYDFVTAVLAEGIERVATFSEDPAFTVLFESSGEVSYMANTVDHQPTWPIGQRPVRRRRSSTTFIEYDQCPNGYENRDRPLHDGSRTRSRWKCTQQLGDVGITVNRDSPPGSTRRSPRATTR